MQIHTDGDRRRRLKGQLHGMGRWGVGIAQHITVVRGVVQQCDGYGR